MLAKTFLLLASLALASAAPAKRQAGRCGSQPVVPTLPTHGNGAELPAPAADLVLKYLALGHGIQNYTCVATDATTLTAVATGALAGLYDAQPLYPNAGPGSLPSVDAFDALTTNTVWDAPLPLVSDGVTRFGASSTAPFPAPADLVLPNVAPLKQIGVHFFDNTGVPTFKVGADILKGAKLDGIKAPSSADPGPEKTGAVDWLQLGDKGGSKGITAVYRVVTAGGVANKCTTAGASDSVPYAAYYWLYGPKA
ncbi:malate dehydrogenase [Colletotrichum graminicola]|uniref:Malate dehydrogenase n=1 Tax=Colletotrichum graminicola (strain M1.001 / M2 / FGSC 10212) TaxID=645133 RepID=E3QKS0_COLGM|nr:malate dehydrogenase [Colletotrichum graminicola M1.001]EFQ31458.1 malate dehydrogenase [Colletotrichum graminicola M1.001]WDK19762.1 malate dehydrogenase [Colletotrichum graminicola]